MLMQLIMEVDLEEDFDSSACRWAGGSSALSEKIKSASATVDNGCSCRGGLGVTKCLEGVETGQMFGMVRGKE